METVMSALAIISIGLYAMIVTAAAQSSTNDEAKLTPAPSSKITLDKGANPDRRITSTKPANPSQPPQTPPVVSTAPVMKVVKDKVLHIRAELDSQRWVQNTNATVIPKGVVANPGQHFPVTNEGEYTGYSAPLGLKDESHNDWIK